MDTSNHNNKATSSKQKSSDFNSRTGAYNNSNVNLYLITIPRCDVDKRYIFNGLEQLCEKLVVSKEFHKTEYIDSCCKNSSVKRRVNQNQSSSQMIDLDKSVLSERSEDFNNLSKSANGSNISMNESQPIASQEDDGYVHCKTHIHIFAEFNEKYAVNFKKVLKIMDWCVKGYNCNVEACKSSRNAIKYVTKEDPSPLLKNVNPGECSFYKQLADWIKANPEFSLFDPFLCSRPNFYKFISSAHADYYKKNPITFDPCRGLKVSNLLTNRNRVREEIQNWFNDCLSNWRLKFPALYLWGESNTGKSTLIFNWLLYSQLNDNQIFRPAKNCQFAWADFNPLQHLCVVMDEFHFSQFDVEEWKNVVEGRHTSVRVKGQSSKVIALRCPIIMISNHEPPNERADIMNRLQVIKSERI